MRLAALLVLASGCSAPCTEGDAPPPGSKVDHTRLQCSGMPACETRRFCLSIDDRIGAEDRARIALALRDWELATRGAVAFVDAEPCARSRIVRTTNDDPWLKAQKQPYARGFTNEEGIHLVDEHTCGSHAFSHVVRHELGHLIGLQHLPDSLAIMYHAYLPQRTELAVQTVDAQAYFDTHRCCPAK
jgi:hypothetical protein